MAAIFEALKVCEHLQSVLKDSFGPCGLDVMLHSSSGGILITNSGGVVLNSLSIGRPMGRVIVEKLKSHSLVTGDGVTSFIIVLTHALKEIASGLKLKEGIGEPDLKPQSWQTLMSLSKGFYKIAIDVAPSNTAPMLNKVAIHTYLINKDEIKEKLTQLIRTTLNGKFSVHCQELFTSLLVDLISNSCELGQRLYQGIMQTLDDFSQIRTEIHGMPVHNSCIIQGFAIPRQFATNDKEVFPKAGKEFFSFLVIQCSLDEVKLTADVTFNIKNEAMLSKALSYKRGIVHSIIQSLKEQDIGLIISSEGVSDMVLHLCQQFEIAVIQMVPMETVNHLCKYGKVQPLCHHDFIELKRLSHIFVGKGKFCKEKTLGVHKFVHLGMTEQNDDYITPHQLLLCAPTKGLCQQYYIALHNGLKTIKMSFSDDKLQLVMLPGCGSVEFLLASEFGKYAQAEDQDKKVSWACSVLSKSLLQVPHKLHSNSYTCYHRHKNFLRVRQEVESSLKDGLVLGVDGKTGNVINPYKQGIFEPLNGKMLWMSHILQCLSMILRVERVISVKCIPGRNNEGDQSSDSEDEEP